MCLQITFDFERNAKKLRHRNSHDLKLHQVRVRIEGWRAIQPVSVDRVGVYFRHAPPDLDEGGQGGGPLPSARVVFHVTLDGCARKLVTVRSALLVCNQLPCSVQLCTADQRPGGDVVIESKATVAVPMMLVHSTLKVRPMHEASFQHYQLSASLQWSHVADPGAVQEETYHCRSTRSHHMGIFIYFKSRKLYFLKILTFWCS